MRPTVAWRGAIGLRLMVRCCCSLSRIRLLSFRYCDLYRVRGEFSLVDDGIRIFKATAIGSLIDRGRRVSVSRWF